MWYVILLIILFVLFNDNKNLKNEISFLKNKVSNQKNFCPNCGYKLNEKYNNNFYTKQVLDNHLEHQQNQNEIVQRQKIKSNISSQEFKNSLILITGAVLIVVAAISFLVSTWYTSANYLKTFVLIVMLLVFLGASFVAEKYLKLKQTSKVFYYIAFSYIPIIFLSISLFGVLGNYLSFSGEGRYIYLLFSCLLISFIYIIYMNKKNSLFLCILSLVFETFSFIFLVLLFTNNINIILISLIIFSILLNLMYKSNVIYFRNSVHKNICTFVTYIFSIVSVIFTFITGFIYVDIFTLILHILFLANIYYFFIKISNQIHLFDIVYPILLIYIGIEASIVMSLGFIGIQMFIIVASFISIFINLLRYKSINWENYFINSISYGITYLVTLVMNSIPDECIIPSYFIIFFYLSFSLLSYYLSNKHKSIISFIVAASICLFPFDFVLYYNYTIFILPFIYLIVLTVTHYILKNNSQIKQSLFINSNIFLNLSVLTCLASDNLNFYILALVSLIAYAIYFSISIKKDYYKIFVYLYIHIFLFSILSAFSVSEINVVSYFLSVAMSINLILELFIYKRHDNSSFIILILEFIFQSLYLFSCDIIPVLIIYLINCLLFVYLLKKFNKAKSLYYIPFFAASLLIYFNYSIYYEKFNIMYPVSIILIAILSYFSCTNEEIDDISKMAFISILLHVLMLSENKYISILMLIIFSFVFYLSKKKKIFMALLYLFVTILSQFIVYDLNYQNITLLSVGPFMILFILLIRTIFYKNNSQYKIYEYLGTCIINLIALLHYTSEMDGMIYILLLVLLIVVSYSLKFGPILLTSLSFIIINVIFLTRKFWLDLPWWIYLLMVGAILIIFAMRNEISNKKSSDLFKEIKDKLDL